MKVKVRREIGGLFQDIEVSKSNPNIWDLKIEIVNSRFDLQNSIREFNLKVADESMEGKIQHN